MARAFSVPSKDMASIMCCTSVECWYFSAALTIPLFYLLDIDSATAAGLFAGSNTNTPALAGLLDIISKSPDESLRSELSNHAVVGYSLSYPMGVIGVMLAIFWCKKWFKVDYRAEENKLRTTYPVNEELTRWSVEITNPELEGTTVRQLFQRFTGRLVFGRMERKGKPFLPNMDTQFELKDQIVIVGSIDLLEGAAELLGKKLDTELSFDRTIFRRSAYLCLQP